MPSYTKSGSLAICLALASSAAFAVDRLVPGTHATVQAAIDAASPSGDRVLITAAGTYVGTVPIPTKADISINIISGKNVTIEASVAGVILTGPVKVENTSTVTLTNVTITNAAKGLVLNDTDTAFPSDFSAANLVGTTVTACTDNGVRLNGCNIVNLTNSAILGSNNTNLIVDGQANHCTVNLTNSRVNGSINGRGVGLHRHSTFSATGSQLNDNKGFGVFIDSFDDVANGVTGVTMTNTQVTGNQDRALFFARAAAGTMTNCTFAGPALSNDLFLLQYGNMPYNLTFTNCTINQSAGNGLAIVAISNSGLTNGSTFNFNQCVVTGGSAGNAIFVNEADSASVFNTITANRSKFVSTNGSNLVFDDSKATLVNCVIDDAGTTAVYSGFGFDTPGSGNQIRLHHCTVATKAGVTSCGVDLAPRAGTAASEVRNSIISGHLIGVLSTATVAPVVSNSVINATTPYVGFADSGNNSTASPLFVTASTGVGTGNFHLQNGSPAISRGVAALSATDYDGGARPQPVATPPDAGAFENATGGVTSVMDWPLFS